MGSRLVLTILAVRDVARATRFYREVFGWSQTVDVPVYAELSLPGGHRLGLYAEEGFARNVGVAPCAPPAGAAVTRTELYVHCDDLEAAVDRALAAGARILAPLAARDWGDAAAYVADPEGNVVAIARPLARGR
jgi:predicted enzyme related to lactoylglutathione lyase